MRGGVALSFAAAWTAISVGCQFAGMQGPVSRSLATSRQLSQQGVAALEHGQWDRAETLLAESVQACPANHDARRSYAEALWQRGQREEAVKQLEQAARAAPDDAAIVARRAEMRLALGQTAAAMEAAQRAIDLDPKLACAWAVRARIKRVERRLTEALADYHRALALCPGEHQVQWELAELYRELNQPERALSTLQGLAERYAPGEEPPTILYAEGLALMALGRAEDAVDSLTAAARHKPTAEILCRLAEAQWQAGRAAEAAATAHQALELDPHHQLSRHLLDRVQLAEQAGGTLAR